MYMLVHQKLASLTLYKMLTLLKSCPNRDFSAFDFGYMSLLKSSFMWSGLPKLIYMYAWYHWKLHLHLCFSRYSWSILMTTPICLLSPGWSPHCQVKGNWANTNHSSSSSLSCTVAAVDRACWESWLGVICVCFSLICPPSTPNGTTLTF